MIYNFQFQYHWARFYKDNALSMISLIGLKTKAVDIPNCFDRLQEQLFHTNNNFIDTCETKQGLWVIHTRTGADNE